MTLKGSSDKGTKLKMNLHSFSVTEPGPPRGGGGGRGGNLPRAPTNKGPPKRKSEAGM